MTAINEKLCYEKNSICGFNFIEKYFKVKLYIITYLFTFVENISK